MRRFLLAAAAGLCLSPAGLSAAAAQAVSPEPAPSQQIAPATPAQAIQPQIPQPQVTQPQVTQPQAIQPQVTPPQVTQPTQPQATQPVQPSQLPQPESAAPPPAAPQEVPAPGAAPDAAPAGAGEGAATDGLQPQAISPAIQQTGTPEPGTVTGTDVLPDLPPLTPPEGEEGLHDLSPWGMYQQADIVVKAVMIGLVIASLLTWTIWFAKSLELFLARRGARKGLDVLRRSQTLSESEATFRAGRVGGGTVSRLVRGALDEAGRSGDLPAEGIKERAAILLSRIEAGAGRRMGVGTGVLASIGSVAPFVGLFGTVWGIMNSFIGIAKSNTTNLAVVAPGIAEALLATAIGLVAAIPAVIIYNMFARSIAGYRALLGDASAEVLRHLSRDLDRAAASGHRGPTAVANLRSAAE